jgi:hypothetical protein
MFGIIVTLAFLECFTLVLAIGRLISPLVFIEDKVIQFLVFSVLFKIVYVMSFIVWYNSYLRFCPKGIDQCLILFLNYIIFIVFTPFIHFRFQPNPFVKTISISNWALDFTSGFYRG